MVGDDEIAVPNSYIKNQLILGIEEIKFAGWREDEEM